MKKIVLTTRLSPDEVLKRLAHITSIEQGKWWITYTRLSWKPYRGRIRENRFEISRIIDHRNSFLPRIKGTVDAAEDDTRIDIRMQLPMITGISFAIWMLLITTACFGMLLIFILQLFAGGMNESSPFLLVPFGMLSLGIFIYYRGFIREARKAEADLCELWHARKISS